MSLLATWDGIISAWEIESDYRGDITALRQSEMTFGGCCLTMWDAAA